VRSEERGEQSPPLIVILINRDLVPPRQEDLDLFDFELSEAEMAATLDAISLPMHAEGLHTLAISR